MEPVNGATTDERGEHSQSAPEGVPNRTHGQDDVEVLAYPLDEQIVHGQRSGLYLPTLHMYTYIDTSQCTPTVIHTYIHTYIQMYTHSVSAYLYMRYTNGDAHRSLEHTVEPTHCLSCHHLHLFDNFCFLVSSIEVGNISCVQNDIDVLNKGLVLYLVVAEEEHGRLALPPSLQHHLHE